MESTGTNNSALRVNGDHEFLDALEKRNEVVVKKDFAFHWRSQRSDRANVVGAGWANAVGHPLNGSGFANLVSEDEFVADQIDIDVRGRNQFTANDLLRQLVFDLALNRTAKRASTECWVVTQFD